MTAHNVDPSLIALADQHKAALAVDLDACIESYRVHRGKTDSTVAFVVLADNIHECMTFNQVCDALALAVQRLAERDTEPAQS